MPKVILRDVGCQYVLSDYEWEWVKTHINVPLELSSINFFDTGEIFYICVYAEGSNKASAVVLFVNCNDVSFELLDMTIGGNRTYGTKANRYG